MGECGKNCVSVCLPVLQTQLVAASAFETERGVSCQGFTLVELIFVVLIVVTLGAIAVPLYGDYIYKANVARAVTEIRALEKEIIFFRTERGEYPGASGILTSLQQIGRDNLLDPWGTPYQYRVLENESKAKCRRDRSYTPLNEDFDLYSVGPDRQVPTHYQITKNVGADAIVRAREGRYVGEGSKF